MFTIFKIITFVFLSIITLVLGLRRSHFEKWEKDKGEAGAQRMRRNIMLIALVLFLYSGFLVYQQIA